MENRVIGPGELVIGEPETLTAVNADRRGLGGLTPQLMKRPGGMDKVLDAQ
ncbi:MAG TPA: hypothetical protein VGK36_01405 [Candidatus Angelobacter sp.]|jgi:hypothetical protein